MKYLIIAISILFLTGCIKEEITLYYAHAKNLTSHKIEIKPYFSGSVPASKIIVLMANETKEIANGFDRGIAGNVGFNSNYLSGSDSIIIMFDNLYSITHYFTQPNSFASKYYLYTSNRNICNKDNYIYTYEDLSKHKRENQYVYEFTEQDY